jgi:hypothetical protein
VGGHTRVAFSRTSSTKLVSQNHTDAFLRNEIRPAERGVRVRPLQVLFRTSRTKVTRNERHYARSPRRFAHSTSALLSMIAIRYEPQLKASGNGLTGQVAQSCLFPDKV